MGRVVVLQLCRARVVFFNGLGSLHLAEDRGKLLVKHLAAALHGVAAVHINGTKAVPHTHTGSGVAIDGRLHGDIVLREFIAGLGIVGIFVHRIQIYLNTKGLQLGLDHFRVAYMGLLCGVDRQCESGDLTICVHIEAIGILFGITGRFHVCICFGRISRHCRNTS